MPLKNEKSNIKDERRKKEAERFRWIE